MPEIDAIDASATLIDILGAQLEYLTVPSEQDLYTVMRGSIPAGRSVPLHSHPDPESFFVLSGVGQVLTELDGRLEWLDVKPGDFFHIPGGRKHAHRNTSASQPLVELVMTGATLGRFFLEIGRPVRDGQPLPPPTKDDVERFQSAAMKYGHWLASPEQNAAWGL